MTPPTPTPVRSLGIALGFGGALLLSSDSLVVRTVDVGPWDVAFWVGLCSGISVFVVLAARGGIGLRREGWPMWASAALQTASSLLFILGVKATTVANVVVILAAAPVVGAVTARVVLGERTGRRVWAAIGATFIGITIVVGDSLGAGRITGDLYALGAVASFAVNLTLWRHHQELRRTLAVGLAGWMMAAAALVPADITAPGTRDLVLLIVLGAVIGPIARICLGTATRHLSAAEVSLFVPVETVSATVGAWIAFGEQPPVATAVGGCIVLGSVVGGLARRRPG
ncbi:MAG: DMT family transporter [Acidimicrobiales bacterium]